MIAYVVSSLLESPAKVLVNTVNTVGVMGKGIAKDFKAIYPEMFKEYQNLCERGQFKVGQLWLYNTPHKTILNFPTKEHWGSPSKIEYIEAGLHKFVNTYVEKRTTSISFPMLGCGNGGLDWESHVKPVMEKYLKNLPIDVFIHLYRNDPFTPEHRDLNAVKEWLRNEPQSLAFDEVWEDITSMLEKERFFSRLEIEEVFEASLSAESEGIVFITPNGNSFLPKEDMASLWQRIRDFGFCMESTLPAGLEEHSQYIMSLLAKLSYLKPVLIDRVDNIDMHSLGLRFLAPNEKSHAGGLFPNDTTNIHQVNLH